MFTITMVGTGSAFSKKYFNTSALVEFPNGYTLLIDCGHSVPQGLHKLGIGLDEIDGIFISHLHADHVGGLEEVALSNMYVHGGRKIDLLVPLPILTPLWDNCLKAGLEPGGFTLTDYFNPKVLYENYTNLLDTTTIRIYRTQHVDKMKSFALGIGDAIFYSADTLFDEGLITVAERYELIFHDCQLFDGGVHASLNELLQLPVAIQEKMFLMHYGDNRDDFVFDTGHMDFAVQGETYKVGGWTK